MASQVEPSELILDDFRGHPTPLQRQNDRRHDAFVDLEGAIEIVVRSRKLRRQVSPRVYLTGIGEEVVTALIAAIVRRSEKKKERWNTVCPNVKN